MDARTFTKMFNTYADAVYKFLHYRLNDKEAAEDLTSIVFTKAWEARETYKGPSEQAWLFTIARNTLIDSYRKRKDIRLDDDAEIESPENIADQADAKILAERLAKSMKLIPEDLRDIVNLRFIQRVSVKDTALRLGLSEANVRVKQHRALKRLKVAYEKSGTHN